MAQLPYDAAGLTSSVGPSNIRQLLFPISRRKMESKMSTQTQINRRQFLQTTALAAAAVPLLNPTVGGAAEGKGKPKVGCLSWCFHDFSPGVDPEPAIDIIGGLGFDGIKKMLTDPDALK